MEPNQVVNKKSAILHLWVRIRNELILEYILLKGSTHIWIRDIGLLVGLPNNFRHWAFHSTDDFVPANTSIQPIQSGVYNESNVLYPINTNAAELSSLWRRHTHLLGNHFSNTLYSLFGQVIWKRFNNKLEEKNLLKYII